LRVTDAIRYILYKQGVFVLNYIDNIIGIAPNDVADVHFKITLNLLNNLGFNINHKKTVPPTNNCSCLGIYFNLATGSLHIPNSKLAEVIDLCNFHLNKKSISKNKLQALIGSLIYLHKAIKPARIFVNRILALLRNMGEAPRVAIDEGTKQDLRWFIACAHAVNRSVKIFKCRQPRYHIYVDASLKGVGGVLHNSVYTLSLPTYPGWCIAHWEAINILVALCTFSQFIKGRKIIIWCDNKVAVSVLNSGRGVDPILQTISRTLWVTGAQLDCDIEFAHIKGVDNGVADLLSRWEGQVNPISKLFFQLNAIPVWCQVPKDVFALDYNI
jgi:hypothetical protein